MLDNNTMDNDELIKNIENQQPIITEEKNKTNKDEEDYNILDELYKKFYFRIDEKINDNNQ